MSRVSQNRRRPVSELAGPLGRDLVMAISVSLIIWFVGPLIAIADIRVLADPTARLVAVLVVMALWRLYTLRPPTADRDADGGTAEARVILAAITARLARVTDRLSRLPLPLNRRRHPYQLPWYLLIGPPDAGKSAVLAQSGLTFLEPAALDSKSAGASEPAACTVRFCEDALFLDIAGRFCTHDTAPATEAAVYSGLLTLIARLRPRQPLNGILLVMPLAALIEVNADRQRSLIATMRLRLLEAQDRLGARLPVYLVLTGVDRLPGFSSLAEQADAEFGDDVWGHTFSTGRQRGTATPAATAEALAALTVTSAHLALDRAERDSSPGAANRSLAFPAQLARLTEPLQKLVEGCVLPDADGRQPFLRGFYFVGAGGDGPLLDGLMPRTPAEAAVSPKPESPRHGWFLKRLFPEVLFREAGLVAGDRGLARRRLILQWSSAIALILMTFGAATLLERSWAANRLLIGLTGSAVVALTDTLTGIAPLTDPDQDLLATGVPLDALHRQATGSLFDDDVLSVWGLGIVPSDSQRLSQAANAAYRRGLELVLLPRLVTRLEWRLRTASGLPLHAAFDAYLALAGRPGTVPDPVERWLRGELDAMQPPPAEPVRQTLLTHTQALMDTKPLATIDAALVEAALGRLTCDRSR